MKKVIFSFAAILMCLLMFTACGGGENTPETTAPAKADISLTEALDKINTEFFDGGSAMKLIESEDKIEAYYGISPDDVTEFAAEVSKNSATEIDEVVLVKAVDSDAAKRIAECLELRLQTQKDLCASYSPELLAVADKCSVRTEGNIVTLIICDNFSEVSDFCDDLIFG